FADVMQQSNTGMAEVIRALRTILGENDMMAYLAMMAVRLLELHRVLKPTGSLYMHCDPTASHYLKLVLDAVFGIDGYRNEVIWKRTSSHNDPKCYGNIHDTLFFYSKSQDWTWHSVYSSYSTEYVQAEFRPDVSGRLVKYENLTAPSHGRDAGRFIWRSVQPPPSRIGRVKLEKLEQLISEGKI